MTNHKGHGHATVRICKTRQIVDRLVAVRRTAHHGPQVAPVHLHIADTDDTALLGRYTREAYSKWHTRTDVRLHGANPSHHAKRVALREQQAGMMHMKVLLNSFEQPTQ